MNPRFLIAIITLSLVAVIAMSVAPAWADDAQDKQLDKRAAERRDANLKRMTIQQEIASQPQGIHKISDGTICIKSGPGMATVHSDGKGCGTGPSTQPAPVVPDADLMAGVFFGLFADPQARADLGLTPDQAAKIKAAYNYMDYQGTNPAQVLPLYEKYAKAPDGKAKDDAEKALMDKVRDIGQAYLNAETKKLKDVKALLTPKQMGQLRDIGAKMVRPFDKPVA